MAWSEQSYKARQTFISLARRCFVNRALCSHRLTCRLKLRQLLFFNKGLITGCDPGSWSLSASVQAILFLAHWFVYATVAHFWGGWAASWQIKLAFALLAMSFVAASLLGWYSYQPLVRFFYLFAALWLGFASYFLLASIASWIIYGVSAVAGLGWRPAWIADAAFAAAVAAGLYGLLNAAWPRVVRITVSLPNLPPQWRGRTAALVSDLHLGHVRNGRFVRRVVNKLLTLQNDIVFIAGDLYDGVAGGL